MKIVSIAVLVGIAAVIGIVVALPMKPGDTPPTMSDNSDFEDSVSVGAELNLQDTPEIIDDSAAGTSTEESTTFAELESFELAEGVSFYIDENGSKHYSLSASDSPQVKSRP